MDLNRFREAFKEGGNLVGLASAAALSAALLNPLPLLVGLVVETAYLLFVPDSRWYTARLARRFDADVNLRRRQLKAQTLPVLRPEMVERFTRLEETRRQIEAQSQSEAGWYREMLRKLDYLMEKFLLFAVKEQEFRNYLQALLAEAQGGNPRLAKVGRFPTNVPSTMPDSWVPQAVRAVQSAYAQEMDELTQTTAREADENSKAILEKRADVLRRRQEHVGKMGKTLTNLGYQLQLLEDTFGLINDEVRARTPEQVLSDIDDVVSQSDVMTKTLEEIAPFEQLTARG